MLQALSKRIHFGKFVAEAKFRAEVEKYSALIKARDAEGLMQELTKPDVEANVVRRVQLKASAYGQDPTKTLHDTSDESKYKVSVDSPLLFELLFSAVRECFQISASECDLLAGEAFARCGAL